MRIAFRDRVSQPFALIGFLPGAEVKANGVLNAGLCESASTMFMGVNEHSNPVDQTFALEWVQKYV